MITRSNLAEQLKEYQIRSKNEWASLSFFSSTSNISSRMEVISVIWELLTLALIVLSAVSLYFGYIRVTFFLVFVAILIFIFAKIAKEVRQSRKSKRRMLLPLSM
ncbi:uncharacterized protein LOC120275658 [Dioscorea cayenensis subsp. rotundata]|uniref:Uncharacterized protein LOC120275658 n=1 Tax=Dioscorea cayennensis subsp. rotundata TaxID=55577 RepID=A0AB40CFV3_DIOCR|nr:uncharacterized protein LOC120275658 [Dioscorea cayenensis subsp. rotundata]